MPDNQKFESQSEDGLPIEQQSPIEQEATAREDQQIYINIVVDELANHFATRFWGQMLSSYNAPDITWERFVEAATRHGMITITYRSGMGAGGDIEIEEGIAAIDLNSPIGE